jgi:CRISPR-associated protein Cas5d
MIDSQIVKVKVWADWACFTRPELKVERMSYPVCTPSAARGVLDAILFKKFTDTRTGKVVPAFHWHIRRITVLRPWWLPDDPERPPYQMVSVRRNEINDKIAPANVKKWMREPASFEPYLVDSMDRDDVQGSHRAQRNTLVLRDVAYLIEASIAMDWYPPTDPPVKYREMFERRVAKGQCFHRPYLGCREFAANFAPPDGRERAVDWNEDLGMMLYDVRFSPDGQNRPGFFLAQVHHGVLHCDTADPAPWGAEPVKVHGWSDEAVA